MNESKFAPMTANLITRKGFAAPSLFAAPSSAMLWEGASPSIVGPAEAADFFEPDERPNPIPIRPPEDVRAEISRAVQDSAAMAVTPEPERPRRIMVLVTPSEIERLAIAAIKKGKTRHEIVREAVDDYLVRLAREFPEPCQCILGGAKVIQERKYGG